jgi:signal transduction histidine kinase
MPTGTDHADQSDHAAADRRLLELATLGEALAMISHEVSNALAPVGLSADLALRHPDDAALARAAVLRAKAAVERVDRITAAVLALAGTHGGRAEHAERESNNLCGVMASAAGGDAGGGGGGGGARGGRSGGGVARVAACIDAAVRCVPRPLERDGITLRVECPADLAVPADTRRGELAQNVAAGGGGGGGATGLEHTLLNLILNARNALIKWSGVVRVLTIRAYAPAAGPSGAAGWCVIEVEDSGPGLQIPRRADARTVARDADAGGGGGGGGGGGHVAESTAEVPVDEWFLRHMASRGGSAGRAGASRGESGAAAEPASRGWGLRIAQRLAAGAGGGVYARVSGGGSGGGGGGGGACFVVRWPLAEAGVRRAA